MKKFFTLAMAMFSMLAIISSCSKSADDSDDNDPPAPDPQEEVKYNVRLVAPLTDVQLEIMDIAITYTIEGVSGTSTPAKMETISLPKTEAIFEGRTSVGKPTVYCIDLPDEYTAKELINGTVEYVATGKKEGIDKYINGNFNIFGRARTFVKPVDEEWMDIDVPEMYEYLGEIAPKSEKDINLLIDIYNNYGSKKPFIQLPYVIGAKR